jgi:hypothetical protein
MHILFVPEGSGLERVRFGRDLTLAQRMHAKEDGRAYEKQSYQNIHKGVGYVLTSVSFKGSASSRLSFDRFLTGKCVKMKPRRQ